MAEMNCQWLVTRRVAGVDAARGAESFIGSVFHREGELLPRNQALQLGHVAGLEFVERRGAEQSHRARDLISEDLDRAVDALRVRRP